MPKIKIKTDHRQRERKLLPDAIQLFEKLALELDAMDPREENFIVILLMRHCQSRHGMSVLEKFGGKPPDNPEKCVARFKAIAEDLEKISTTDETFVVNCLQQAWQRRAAVRIDELQTAIDTANEVTVQ